MALKIRLSRRGRRKMAMYSIVVADARSPRDGRFIEKIGTYNPHVGSGAVSIDVSRSLYWLSNGAKPTDTARRLLSSNGVMLKRHLHHGMNKGVIDKEEAEKRFSIWLNNRSKRGLKFVMSVA